MIGSPRLLYQLRHYHERNKRRTLPAKNISRIEPLLLDVLTEGKLVCERPTTEQIRAIRLTDVASLDEGVRRLINPHFYHVSVSEKLWALQENLLRSLSKGRVDPAF